MGETEARPLRETRRRYRYDSSARYGAADRYPPSPPRGTQNEHVAKPVSVLGSVLFSPPDPACRYLPTSLRTLGSL